MVSLATQQDKEVGDGTTSVVLLASELLRRANDLVRNKIHPTTVITGYRSAPSFTLPGQADRRVDSRVRRLADSWPSNYRQRWTSSVEIA